MTFWKLPLQKSPNLLHHQSVQRQIFQVSIYQYLLQQVALVVPPILLSTTSNKHPIYMFLVTHRLPRIKIHLVSKSTRDQTLSVLMVKIIKSHFIISLANSVYTGSYNWKHPRDYFQERLRKQYYLLLFPKMHVWLRLSDYSVEDLRLLPM